MLVLLLCMTIDFLAGRLKLLDETACQRFSALLVNVTNPAMILYSVMEGEITLTTMQVLLILVISIAAHGAMYVIARLTPRLLRLPAKEWGIYQFMIMFGNVGFMGFPVVRAMFGPQAVFYAAVFTLPFNMLTYTLGVKWVSQDGKAGKFNWKLLVGPNVIASLITFGLYLIRIRLPGPIVTVTGMLADVTTPLAMLIIGSSLARMDVKSVLLDGKIYGMCAIRLLLFPMLLWFVVSRFQTDPLILGLVVVEAAMPVATAATMLCVSYNGREETASKGVFVSTILSMVTIPFLMWLLF